MLRASFGLLLVAGFMALLANPQSAFAQKGGNSGPVLNVDAKTGAITFKTQVPIKGTKKSEQGEKQLLLDDDAKVTIVEGGQTKKMTGKEAIAAGAIKEGAMATWVNNGLKITELTIGGGGKK